MKEKEYLLEVHRKYHDWELSSKLGLTDKPYIPKGVEEEIFKRFVEKHGGEVKHIEDIIVQEDTSQTIFKKKPLDKAKAEKREEKKWKKLPDGTRYRIK